MTAQGTSWLDQWKAAAEEVVQLTLETAQLTSQVSTKSIEAEYALAMHKSIEFGKMPYGQAAAKPAAEAVRQPAQQPVRQPVLESQPDKPAPIKCVKCGKEIKDSASTTRPGEIFTAAKKAALSLKKNSQVLCYECEQGFLKVAA